jgi:hypothetical protein
VQGFFDRWIGAIPVPFTSADRAAGYWWELSVRQVEASRTLVFDDPRRARGFFESLVADNIGIGRPHEVAAVFARRVIRTRVFGAGTEVRLEFAYKHSRVKQYLKEGRALRIETVINKPSDVGCKARLEHLPELVAKRREVNRRLLEIERAGQGCAIGSALFERIHQPYIRRANEPEPCASGIHAPWPWPAHSAASSTPSPASPTQAFAGWWPGCSGGTTPPTR